MEIKIISFGYHYGVPESLYLVIDARILRNPHNSKKLRKLNGLDAAVQEDVFSSPVAQEIVNKISAAIKMAQKENRTSITIGVGCSFGHHRSVAIVQRASEILNGCEVEHRDIARLGK